MRTCLLLALGMLGIALSQGQTLADPPKKPSALAPATDVFHPSELPLALQPFNAPRKAPVILPKKVPAQDKVRITNDKLSIGLFYVDRRPDSKYVVFTGYIHNNTFRKIRATE